MDYPLPSVDEKSRPVVDVVLPCLDEVAALPSVIAALPAGFRALVVDNGSTDGSPALAARLGATVVSESRRGYGAAVHAGLLAATAEYVAVMDCDGSLDAAELPKLLALIENEKADLVCGRRRAVGSGVWPWHARLGNALLAAMISRNGARLRDLAPMRMARRDTLLGLGITDRRCGYPLETVLRARAAGLRIVEVEVGYLPRAAGTRSKITGTVRGTLTVAKDFVSVWYRLRSLGVRQVIPHRLEVRPVPAVGDGAA